MGFEEFKEKYNHELVDFVEVAINFIACIKKSEVGSHGFDDYGNYIVVDLDDGEILCLSVLLAFLKTQEMMNLFTSYNIDYREICETVDVKEELLFDMVPVDLLFQKYFYQMILDLGDIHPLGYFLHLAKSDNVGNNVIPSLIDPYVEEDAYKMFNPQLFPRYAVNNKILEFKNK